MLQHLRATSHHLSSLNIEKEQQTERVTEGGDGIAATKERADREEWGEGEEKVKEDEPREGEGEEAAAKWVLPRLHLFLG